MTLGWIHRRRWIGAWFICGWGYGQDSRRGSCRRFRCRGRSGRHARGHGCGCSGRTGRGSSWSVHRTMGRRKSRRCHTSTDIQEGGDVSAEGRLNETVVSSTLEAEARRWGLSSDLDDSIRVGDTDGRVVGIADIAEREARQRRECGRHRSSRDGSGRDRSSHGRSRDGGDHCCHRGHCSWGHTSTRTENEKK